MVLTRASFCIAAGITGAAIALSGCIVSTQSLREKLARGAQTETLEYCGDLFADSTLDTLKGKMVFVPGSVPTQEMLLVDNQPGEEALSAIKLVEEKVRACKQLRADAGHETSAMEDIAEARISKLRYGLYKGDIPYGVYNYGVAQVRRESQQFAFEKTKAYAEGKVIGNRAALAQLNQQINQMNMQTQMNSMQSQLNSYQSTNYGRTWSCSGSGGMYSCY